MILSLMYSRFLLTEIINNYRNEGTKRLLEFLKWKNLSGNDEIMIKEKKKKKFFKILIYRLIGRKD